MKANRPAIRPSNQTPRAIHRATDPAAANKAAGNKPKNPVPAHRVRKLRPTKAVRKATSKVRARPATSPAIKINRRNSTGSAAKQQAQQGSNGQKQPGAEGSGPEQKQSAGSSSGQEQQKPSDGGKPDNQLGKANSKSGSGNPGTGGQEGGQTDIEPQPESQPSAADEANLDYARKQTELALEHLEDQLAKDKPDLLERLGWTRQQAQHFIDRWQQLRQAADEKSPRGEAAKKQLDDALKSLGLRPGTTYLKHGGTKTDQLQDLRRFRPLRPSARLGRTIPRIHPRRSQSRQGGSGWGTGIRE